MGRKKRNAKNRPNPPPRLPTKREIAKLPVRGIVYYAWRCATRVEKLIGGGSINHVDDLAIARQHLTCARDHASSFSSYRGKFPRSERRQYKELYLHACMAVDSIKKHERATQPRKSAIVNAATASRECAIALAWGFAYPEELGRIAKDEALAKIVVGALNAAKHANLAAARLGYEICAKLRNDFEKASKLWPVTEDDKLGRPVERSKLPALNDGCKPFASK